MDNDKLMEFLKGYAEALKEIGEDKLLESGAFPLQVSINMPGGYCEIKSCNGSTLGYVRVKDEPTCSSMPVGPKSVAYAKFFVELANLWAEHCGARGR